MTNVYIVKRDWVKGKGKGGKVNGVGKGSGLRTDPQRKEQKWGV